MRESEEKVTGGKDEAAAGAGGKTPCPAAEEAYRPYSATPGPEFSLWVRTNDANRDCPNSVAYSRRVLMIPDHNWSGIFTHYDMPNLISVYLKGRNLGELWRKLLKHEVEWVMEFDAAKWPVPPDGAPCITSIEIRWRRRAGETDELLPGETQEAGMPETPRKVH